LWGGNFDGKTNISRGWTRFKVEPKRNWGWWEGFEKNRFVAVKCGYG